MQNTDSTFITNDSSSTLLDRFKVLIKDTKYFDVLVGYFFASGFYALKDSLKETEKIRILIGISTDRKITETVNKAQIELEESHAETKEAVGNMVIQEFENTEDKKEVEEGILTLVDWLVTGKAEIKAYPTENIHSKLYIMTFDPNERDMGRVITGSSNFTMAGLRNNLEFNVELKNRSDYEFALNKFNELWAHSVDIKETYMETVRTKTWINNTITPYELYLKFLYEYFKDDLNRSFVNDQKYLPEGFKKLEYQDQAVIDALKILEVYNGVFISDVVGLGKTYITTMIAQHLTGRTLVIAPPVLLDDKNPGSWTTVFYEFHLSAKFKSIGLLDEIISEGTDNYENVIIDEAHRFRTEETMSYEKLAQICRNKKVILVTATPYNNHPKDILSQIKLFQKGRRSTIPNLSDIEGFINKLSNRLTGLDRLKDRTEYLKIVKENSKEIREKLLQYLMVRRTRSEIEKYFKSDLDKQKMKFPEIIQPKSLFYELNEEENKVFDKTIELITNPELFTYARYTPLLFLKEGVTQPEEIAQINMGKFMRILLVKRLESSFFAFRQSVTRFVSIYEKFITEYENGKVYVSKGYGNKIYELLEEEDLEAVQRLVDEGKAKEYATDQFKPEFIESLRKDLQTLKIISEIWYGVQRDPKLIRFIKALTEENEIQNSKIIVFTESKETAEYLYQNIKDKFNNKVLIYTGGSSASDREKVIENFDAKSRFPKDDFRILIATEVLSEGVNLHRSNVVLNYDIPWNPTRLMQRVGRINRVDTKFDKIYTYNFFPTQQSNDQIKLKEAAIAKIEAFISMLGADAQLLTEGEVVESFELFNRLVSVKTISGEDDSEVSDLRFLKVIRDIRDNDIELFDKIKHLPKKARTAKNIKDSEDALITYFRKGRIQKFYRVTNESNPQELNFITTAIVLESTPEQKRVQIGDKLYDLLDKNKLKFETDTFEESIEPQKRVGRDSALNVLKKLKSNIIKNFKGFTEEEDSYIKAVIKAIEEGGLPKHTSKVLSKELEKLFTSGGIPNPLAILTILKTNIPKEFLEESSANIILDKVAREVILSEYLKTN